MTLAAFFDAGMNRLVNTKELDINPERIAQLNAEFPQANFSGKAVVAPGTQKIRASTGLELQVLMPVVNAPASRVLRRQPVDRSRKRATAD